MVPIAAPRGLPPDVCLEIQEESDSWDLDGYAHSYLLVSELVAYNWDQPAARFANDFPENVIPKLKALAGDDLTSVRIVFWFDN